MRCFVHLPFLLAAAFCAEGALHAQLSLTTAVDMAEKADPRVRMAQADVDRAGAALRESRDVFIPAVGTSGGVGRSAGVPLYLPVVFNLSAQSLVFNFSQREFIRSAHAGLDAATSSLQEAKTLVAEETVNTYLELDEAEQRRDALLKAVGYAERLVEIVQARYDAGQDPHIELTRAQRNLAQLRLQQIQSDDGIEYLSRHLGQLTGLGQMNIHPEHASIPAMQLNTQGEPVTEDSASVRAAFANAKAKQETAIGQQKYIFRPSFGFSANYSRINTAFTSYQEYYPAFNPDTFRNLNHHDPSYNAFSLGVQVTLPLLDRAHAQRTHEAQAEARHALAEAQNARNQLQETRLRLGHGLKEHAAQLDLSTLDQQLAQDQVENVMVQLQSPAGSLQGPQMSPKDEQYARLAERQRFIDVLAARLELQETAVRLMHQNGTLEVWLRSALSAQPPAGSTGTPDAPSAIFQPVPQPD